MFFICGRTDHLATFSTSDRKLRPITWIFETDSEDVKLNQHVKYLGLYHSVQKLLFGHTHTHTRPDRFLSLDHWAGRWL